MPVKDHKAVLGFARTGAERRGLNLGLRIGLEKNKNDTFVPFLFSERETGIEPATPSLARRCSTAEPLARIYEADAVRNVPSLRSG